MKQSVPAGDLHEAVIRSFTKDILTPDMLEAVVVQRLTDAGAPKTTAAKRAAVQAEVRRVDTELKRLGDAVAAGAAVETLLGAIKAREAERRGLLARIEQLDELAKAAAACDRDASPGGSAPCSPTGSPP